MVICIAPLTGGYLEVLSAWQAGEKKSSNYVGTQVISTIASHSGVQGSVIPECRTNYSKGPVLG